MRARRGPAALLLAAVFVLLTGAPVLAAPPIGGGGSTGGGGGGSNGGGGSSSGGGNGGGGPSSVETVTTIFLPATGSPECGTQNAAGDPMVGVLIRVTSAGETTLTGTSTCVYATPAVVRSVVCGLDVAATYTGATGNPAVTPRTQSFPRVVTRFGQGERTIAACNDSRFADFNTDTSDWGHHTLTVTGRQVRCESVTYTNAAPRIRSCGAPYVSSGMTVEMTTWCGGWEEGHTSRWPWTIDGCKDQPGRGGWSCAVPPFTVDGRTGVRQLFADGAHHALGFGSGPRAVGIEDAVFRQGRLTEAPDSRPRKPGWEDRATGISDWDAQWWGGSDRDRPWKANASWVFDGWITITVPGEITTGVDGSVSVGTRTERVPVTGSCDADLVIDQKRARNTN